MQMRETEREGERQELLDQASIQIREDQEDIIMP